MWRMIVGFGVCVIALLTGAVELAIPGCALYLWGFVSQAKSVAGPQ
jgi:hypothetical protein